MGVRIGKAAVVGGIALVIGAAAAGMCFVEERQEREGEIMERVERACEEDVKETVVFRVEDAEPGTVVGENEIDRGRLGVYFASGSITEDVLLRIDGRSYQPGGEIGLEELRYLKVLHYNFEHKIQVGEMIVNAGIADEMCNIFRELFESEYEIASVLLIDNFWSGGGVDSDEASVRANNSSAFCYRVIAGTEKLSRHAFGCAVDINPLQNPFVVYTNGTPYGYPAYSGEFVERRQGKSHVIVEDDICCRIFKEHGFTWGGSWENPKDYQHFEYNQK